MNESKSGDRAWEIILKAMVPLSLALGTWLAATTFDHAKRLERIEESRFTKADALEMERRIIDRSVPKWLANDLKQINESLTDVRDRLRALEKKVQ